MKILITARYIEGLPEEGGSGRFMRCVAGTLKKMGHEIITTTDPAPHAKESFDYIIISHHEQFEAIKANPSQKIYISHGIIEDEKFRPGANKYISISEEVRQKNLTLGIDSTVIGQPIEILEQKRPSDILQKILIIRRENLEENLFAFLSEKYEIRCSNLEEPIENQIAWADLCITLGRGALESMAQGKPVLVADNRHYMNGAKGDGYITAKNIKETALCNYSGRRYGILPTREWIEAELAKYNPHDSDFLYGYVKENHTAEKIISRYFYDPKFSFGVMINDAQRFNTILGKSVLPGKVHYVMNPESATKGLNQLLETIENEGADIAVLAHQDMYFRQGWLVSVRNQLVALPDSWLVAGIIGKDMQGRICGNLHDMRMVDHFNTTRIVDDKTGNLIHSFPEPAACFDECVLIINMKKGFRFDESLDGFDLYGTLSCLQAWEANQTTWIIDAFAEHYCLRPFSWMPGDDFRARYKMLYDRWNEKFGIIDSTVLPSKSDMKGFVIENKRFETSA